MVYTSRITICRGDRTSTVGELVESFDLQIKDIDRLDIHFSYGHGKPHLVAVLQSIMDSALVRAFQRDVIEGSVEPRKFILSLKDEPSESVIDFCRWVVSNFTYEKHTMIIKAAFHKLAHLRDIYSLEHLENLENIWANTYLEEYEYLISLLKNAQAGAKCNCNVYQDRTFNTPPYQDDLEEIGTGKRDHDGFIQTDLIYVRCRLCESEWEVEIDYTYHYPHSHWRRNN